VENLARFGWIDKEWVPNQHATRTEPIPLAAVVVMHMVMTAVATAGRASATRAPLSLRGAAGRASIDRTRRIHQHRESLLAMRQAFGDSRLFE